MLPTLLRKCWFDARWLLAATTAAVFAFCWLRVWIVSRVDTSRFKAILDLLPTDWQKFTPVDFEWLITYPGRISLAYDELIVVMCVSIWSVARGSDCVSGEINRGTMEMLLAQPVSRLRWILAHASITVLGLVLLAAAAWAGNYVGIQLTTVNEQVTARLQLPFPLPVIGSELPNPFGQPTTRVVPMAERVDPMILIPASFNLFALGFMLAGFATAMSSWDRYRWRTIGLVVAVYVVQLVVKLAGMASPQWHWLLRLSIFTAYEPEYAVRLADRSPELAWSFWVSAAGEATQFGPLAYHSVLLAVGAICYVLAVVIFCRRDVPAPL